MGTRLRVWLCVSLLGCGGAPVDDGTDTGLRGPVEVAADSDADGLCDVTEAQLGSDPERPDSDGDGVPDVFEYLLRSALDDPATPTATQLAALAAERDAAVQVELRVTVDGGGEGHAGVFEPIASVYPGQNAGDFFVAASALSAQPPDNVRGLDAAAARFGTVIGATRLSFALSFAYDLGEPPHDDCIRAYPLRFTVKADGNTDSQSERLLLLTIPPGLGADAPYCFPDRCL